MIYIRKECDFRRTVFGYPYTYPDATGHANDVDNLCWAKRSF